VLPPVNRTLTLAVLLVLTLSAPADARQPLSKREARREALRFVQPFVDLLDLERTVTTRMVPPHECRRRSRYTVSCRFTAHLEAENRSVGGSVRVHRQRDGLLGFRLPWDPTDVWVD
jgi:hypothetical protein